MSLTIFNCQKTPFQAIKTKSLKSRKIDIFPKGLTHGFGPKMAIFPTFFFQAIQARKMSFMIFQNRKTPFQAIKTRSSKSRKIDIFPKELTHRFSPKMASFQTFFFRQYKQGKCLLRYPRTKKRLPRLQKQEEKNVEQFTLFIKGGSPQFLSKNRHFSKSFYQVNICQENVFYDILQRKNAFLGYKNKKLKKSKN